MRQALSNSNRATDAEDAFQDACVQFLRAYDGPPGTDALRWMMVVTKHCAWHIGRRRARRECAIELSTTDHLGAEEEPALIPSAAPDLDPADLVERRQRDAGRRAALAALKSDERTALVLQGAGYSYAEIGQRHGWTYTKVNRCVAEGRLALRKAIADSS